MRVLPHATRAALLLATGPLGLWRPSRALAQDAGAGAGGAGAIQHAAEASDVTATVAAQAGHALSPAADAAHGAAAHGAHGGASVAEGVAHATAEHAAAAGTEGMFQAVTGILIVAVCYLLADTVVERIQRRFLVLAGVQFLLLGFMLGPQVPWVDALNNLSSLFPLIALAAGWVGLLTGTEFDTDELRATTGSTWSIVLLHHLVPGALTGGAAYFLLTGGYVGEVGPRAAGVCSAVLGCCAAADSAAPFELLGRRYLIQGRLAPLLSRAARFGDVFIIIAFSVVFSVFHGSSEGTADAAEWWLTTLGLGMGLGLLFTPFLGGDESENGRFLALVGIITFASGAAYFLKLSPLAVNVVLGIVLANLSKGGWRIRATLRSTEKPMALILLILAGALWKPSPWVPTLVGLVAFVLLRLVGKRMGSWLGARGSDLRHDLYRGLMAHGTVTVAMAVSFRLVYERIFPDTEAIDIAYSVILGSVILNDLIAPRVLRALLVDAGDLDRELADTADADSDADGIPDGEQDGMLSGIVPVGVTMALPSPPRMPRESELPARRTDAQDSQDLPQSDEEKDGD